MKRLVIYLICSLLSVPLLAQTRLWSSTLEGEKRLRDHSLSSIGLRTTQYDGVHHLIGISVDAAYSALLTNMPYVTQTPGGYGVGLGLHYAYLNGKLLVQLGADVRWQDVQNKQSDICIERKDIDTWGIPFDLKYDIVNRSDKSRNLYVEVPLQAGFIMIGGCYVLIGPKLNFQVYGSTYSSNITTTTARYPDRYIGVFEEMDNHGIRKEVPLNVKHEKLNFKFNVMASAEVGYEFGISTKGYRSYRKNDTDDYRLRIAGFVDIGLLNIMPKGDAPLYNIPEETRYDFATFEFNHPFSTIDAQNYSLHNLFTGVKLSFFFYGYQSQEKCILCGSRGIQRKYRK